MCRMPAAPPWSWPTGSPPPDLGGVDPTITIPAIRITLDAGNSFKANLPVAGGLRRVAHPGADDGGLRLYAPTARRGRRSRCNTPTQ